MSIDTHGTSAESNVVAIAITQVDSSCISVVEVQLRSLKTQLVEWVDDKSKLGIFQHEPGWIEHKVYTVGGTSIADFEGTGYCSSMKKVVDPKIGKSKFNGNLATRWGNVFEEVIRPYTEYKRNCEVLGDNLYVLGPEHTAYSPDGLAVIDDKVILLEFKCPYSRTPTGIPPKNYVSQVKMGLDLLEIAQEGLLIEAVFKLRSLEWLRESSCIATSDNASYLACGFIGFYFPIDNNGSIAEIAESYGSKFSAIGHADNQFVSNDLSQCDDRLLNDLFRLYTDKKIRMWKSEIRDGVIIDEQINLYIEHCKVHAKLNMGILPWVLLSTCEHKIKKEVGYLQPMLPKIARVIEFVRRYNGASDDEKEALYTNTDMTFSS